ncbi:hypothetical protein [Rosenbergiella australiborealis]|uniref:hypothetical protein n=1 Tax=Rosenbergiella australiborealis TaxID=1544696 RepID=UPI001BD97566|nr:hypothetical protein [Rosenbergiella australiborealis]
MTTPHWGVGWRDGKEQKGTTASRRRAGTGQLNLQRPYGLSGDTGGQHRAVWINVIIQTVSVLSSSS